MALNDWSKTKLAVTAALCAGAAGAAAAGTAYTVKKVVWFHNYCKLVPYEIKSVKDSKLTEEDDFKIIAHRGFRAVAPENTLPAYEAAGKAGYWGAECDIYMTKDGVWVLHHDPVTYRMMDRSRILEQSTYSELLKLNYKNGHNIDEYEDLKICTLEDFFITCAKYNMTATIELKYNRNREYYYKILALQEKYKVPTTYIAFAFEDLQKLRTLCDAPLFLLVDEITQEAIDKAKSLENCGISYNCNIKANLANDGEMIKKIHAEGLTTASWTCDELDLMEKLVGYGTKFITTNCITY